MNYQKIYDQIVERAKTRQLEGYKEKHHIIPKCLGGSNDKENLVLLTPREHYVCHKLLTYIYKGNRKIACALFRLCYDKNNRKISSKDYEYVKKIIASIGHSDETNQASTQRKYPHKPQPGLQQGQLGSKFGK